jgi:hypothetical protein
LGVDNIGLDDDWLGVFLDGFLGELDSVVDDEERVVASEDLIVEGNSVQILFKD